MTSKATETAKRLARNFWLFVLILCASSACDTTTEPRNLQGKYTLAAVNGSIVPMLFGPAPYHPFDPQSGCLLSYTEGDLTISTELHTFTLYFGMENSCSPGRVYLTSNEIGTFVNRGNTIEFSVFDGQQYTKFHGRISEKNIDVVMAENLTLSFTR